MLKIKYRNEYLITNTVIEIFEGWNSERFHDGALNIHFHPDLPYASAEKDDIEISLLGYILDPDYPYYTNNDIVTTLSHYKTFNLFLKHTFRYAGRYVFIYKHSISTYIFSDPLGFRQVFYYQYNGHLWYASQPKLISHYVTLEKRSDEPFNDFVNSATFLTKDQAMIGDETTYEGVRHLLPNHCIDVRRRTTFRFWPNQPIRETSLKEAIAFAAEQTKGLLKSARQRYKLAIPFTSGWDSRLTVAASRDLKDDIYYYVTKYAHLNTTSADIRIPTKLSQYLKLNFSVLELDELIDDSFIQIYNTNYQLHQERYVRAHYSLYKKLQNKLVVSTGGSEIIRGYYFDNPIPTISNSGKIYAALAGYPKIQYVIAQSDKWLNTSFSVAKDCNLSPVDLFYWEQRVGNWSAQVTALGDVYSETFSLFSCRDLLVTMMSVNYTHRKYDNELYRCIMNELWPEILREPINPPASAKAYIKDILRRRQIYSFGKKIKVFLKA